MEEKMRLKTMAGEVFEKREEDCHGAELASISVLNAKLAKILLLDWKVTDIKRQNDGLICVRLSSPQNRRLHLPVIVSDVDDYISIAFACVKDYLDGKSIEVAKSELQPYAKYEYFIGGVINKKSLAQVTKVRYSDYCILRTMEALECCESLGDAVPTTADIENLKEIVMSISSIRGVTTWLYRNKLIDIFAVTSALGSGTLNRLVVLQVVWCLCFNAEELTQKYIRDGIDEWYQKVYGSKYICAG